MGSSILYGAINDLDIGEAKIPSFTPPGLPERGESNKLYGTSLAPESAWAIGVKQRAQILAPDQIPEGLNDQSATQISAEAYVRGGNKYEEQAEELLKEEDKDQTTLAVKQALV